LWQDARPHESENGDSGYYVLFLHLDLRTRITVGSLGRVDFPAGRYAYVGRARRNLRRRVERHLRRPKKLRWHIDYLLRHAMVERVLILPIGGREECSLAKSLCERGHGKIYPPRFGSSDCRCPGHLVYLGESGKALLTESGFARLQGWTGLGNSDPR